MTSITLSKRHRTPMSAQDMGRQMAAFSPHDEGQAALRARKPQSTLHLPLSENRRARASEGHPQASLLDAEPACVSALPLSREGPAGVDSL